MNLRTAPATIALGVVGLLVLSALSWMLLLGPTLGELGDAKEKHTAVEDRNLVMAAQLNSLRSLAADVPLLQRTAKDLMATMPPTADQPGFFREITAAAEGAGLRAAALTSVAPGVPVLPAAPAAPAPDPDAAEGAPVAQAEPAPQVAVQSVSVSVNGTYDQLRKLLANIETMDRALLLQNVNLTGEDGELTMTLTGSTFVAPPLGDPPVTDP